MQRINLWILVGLMSFVSHSLPATPAQSDYKLKDLRGTVRIEFHDVRIPEGKWSMSTVSKERTIDGGRYITDCQFILRGKDAEAKKDNPRVVERAAEYKVEENERNSYSFSYRHQDFVMGSFATSESPQILCQ